MFLFYRSENQGPEKHLSLLTTIQLGGGFQVVLVKNLPAKAGDVEDLGSITGSGRSPGGGHGSLPQYSCLKNPMDRGASRLQSVGSQRAGHKQRDLVQYTVRKGLSLDSSSRSLISSSLLSPSSIALISVQLLNVSMFIFLLPISRTWILWLFLVSCSPGPPTAI